MTFCVAKYSRLADLSRHEDKPFAVAAASLRRIHLELGSLAPLPDRLQIQRCCHAYLVAIIVEQAQRCLAEDLHAAAGDSVAVALGRDAQEGAVADDAGVVDADVARQLRVCAQEGVLPVHWQEVLRLHQLHHLLQLLPARCSMLFIPQTLHLR